ncbi:voltage-gated chloride channel family protein [Limimaricola hongkongensis DSM 17492]|uniref:Voltage-gated chloride channel family protein n=2 Tax=Limimaricola hongkongensis TaxID=278132 RepID=A0A017H9Q5_9RHOB|nr:voltage-gated chloride channel family protein [Limimaricola hongkongensis DSM 17492]
MMKEGVFLQSGATLEEAMPLFEATGSSFIPVVRFGRDDAGPELWGALFQVDSLRALNRALTRMAAEEHS